MMHIINVGGGKTRICCATDDYFNTEVNNSFAVHSFTETIMPVIPKPMESYETLSSQSCSFNN